MLQYNAFLRTLLCSVLMSTSQRPLIFLTDSSTQVRKIWETSRKSLSQGTITQPGWASEPLPFPSQHSSSMVTGQARKFCSLPLRQQLFFPSFVFQPSPAKYRSHNRRISPTHTDVIIWLLILGEDIDFICNFTS